MRRASFLVLGTIVAGAWLVAAAFALADRRVMRQVRAVGGDADESVTMILPARNETQHVAAWIAGARSQHVRTLRIVVVDDNSTDGTYDAALDAAEGDPRVDVLRAGPLPRGWVGKCWAAHLGSQRATSEWLLFSDADVRLEPAATSSALAAAKALRADALSFTTTLVCHGFWEQVIMPGIAAIIFSAIPAWATRASSLPIGLLAGGFLLVRTRAYELVGGHSAVRASIAEDRDLAERLKAFGCRICLADGSALVCVRMYEGLREMWFGWQKNFYEGVRRRPLGAALTVVGFVGMLVLPLPTLAGLAVKRLQRPLARHERWLGALSATSVGATILVRLIRDRAIGIKTTAISVLGTPLAGLFAASVMAASAWNVETGRGQQWKGRTIP